MYIRDVSDERTNGNESQTDVIFQRVREYKTCLNIHSTYSYPP